MCALRAAHDIDFKYGVPPRGGGKVSEGSPPVRGLLVIYIKMGFLLEEGEVCISSGVQPDGNPSTAQFTGEAGRSPKMKGPHHFAVGLQASL